MSDEPQVRRRGQFRESTHPSTAFVTQFGSHMLRVSTFPSKSHPDDHIPEHEVVVLQFNNLKVGLTALTEEELRALYEGVKLAVFHALPTVRMLDQEAEEAAANGTAVRPRFYRRSPVVALKKRLFGSHADGIGDRFKRVVDLDIKRPNGIIDPTGLAASNSSRLASPQETEEDSDEG